METVGAFKKGAEMTAAQFSNVTTKYYTAVTLGNEAVESPATRLPSRICMIKMVMQLQRTIWRATLTDRR